MSAARRALCSGARLSAGAVSAALLLTACSNQQPAVTRKPQSGATTASTSNGVQQVTVVTGDDYRFHPASITVHPGTVRIVLQHAGKGAPHNLTFLQFGAATPLTTAGHASEVTFTAPAPGTYTFVCTIHRAQGQTGTLVVLAQ